jgi:hypothetical protein
MLVNFTALLFDSNFVDQYTVVVALICKVKLHDRIWKNGYENILSFRFVRFTTSRRIAVICTLEERKNGPQRFTLQVKNEGRHHAT